MSEYIPAIDINAIKQVAENQGWSTKFARKTPERQCKRVTGFVSRETCFAVAHFISLADTFRIYGPVRVRWMPVQSHGRASWYDMDSNLFIILAVALVSWWLGAIYENLTAPRKHIPVNVYDRRKKHM